MPVICTAGFDVEGEVIVGDDLDPINGTCDPDYPWLRCRRPAARSRAASYPK